MDAFSAEISGTRTRITSNKPTGARLLILLALGSYATSFLRERYLIQHTLGSRALDEAVAAYAVASMLGNLVATALGIIWIDGRRIPRWASAFGWYAVVGAIVAARFPTVGACILLASLVAAFDFSRQRAVFRYRQPAALASALVAPIASVTTWHVLGAASLSSIVFGYSAGFFVQALGAWFAARGAIPSNRPRADFAPTATVLYPIAFAAMSQANGLLDRLLLGFAGAGWAGAGAFSQNLASAAMLVVIGPLASEAVAGRVATQPSKRAAAVILGTTALGVATCALWLPLLVGGGFVSGANLDHVQAFAMVYLAAIPAVGYVHFRSRAVQSAAIAWRSVAWATVAMLAAHMAVSFVALALGYPIGVAVGSAAGAVVGALLLAPDRWV